ncbi:hypothetical protein [Flavobacterium sp. 3HN19-14]|uniref:hypothetical protein n=1 Tax=Flavobacterium sp. 3HN19-14 TaxID=3448133 RepID=UPI003EE3B482
MKMKIKWLFLLLLVISGTKIQAQVVDTVAVEVDSILVDTAEIVLPENGLKTRMPFCHFFRNCMI